MTDSPSLALSYQLRRSQRAKNTRIIIGPGKFEVVAPQTVAEWQIKAFVESQRHWIQTTLKRFADSAHNSQEITPRHYADGTILPYFGRQLQLRLETSTNQRITARLQTDDSLLVRLPGQLPATPAAIREAVIKWYKNQARLHVQALIDRHAPTRNLWPRNVRIKTQKSRWGSCGASNDININWLLMLAPAKALEYVVVHELCHIRHKNHSRDFWLLVAEHVPDYQQQRRWLKQHGATVMRGL